MTVEVCQGGAQPCGDEDQEEDSGDPAVHHGCEAGPTDHQSASHLPQGVHHS